MKRIVLCADDYGQNFAVSQAIIHLFEKNRLTATSCLSNALEWPKHASLLLPFRGHVDIGLHFNLTEGAPLSVPFQKQYGARFPSLARLILRSQLRWLDKAAIQAEFDAQLGRFTDCLGQLPDFIDGHQHIHQFPVIREVVLAGMKRHLKQNNAYIRCTHQPILNGGRSVKRLIIEATGARAFKKALVAFKIPHNSSFEGVYDFGGADAYSAQVSQFLHRINDRGLMMCHPGLASNDPNDPIAFSRYHEYQYLMSEQFIVDCKAEAIHCVRFQEIR